MKRDFDLLRDMLIEVEHKKEPIIWVSDVDADADGVSYGFGDSVRQAHFELLKEAGFVAECFNNYEGRHEFGYRLTWSGHDYLDAIKDAEIWARTKATVAASGGSVAFEVMKALAVGLAKKKISQHAGIDL